MNYEKDGMEFSDTITSTRLITYENRPRYYRQVLIVKGPRTYKQKKKKGVWASYLRDFEREKWNPKKTANDFLETYKVHAIVVHSLESLIKTKYKNRGQINKFGTVKGTGFKIGDLILMAIKWLRGNPMADICETFGSRPRAARRAVTLAFKLLEEFAFVFRKGQMTPEEEKTVRERLAKKGVPFPEIVYVGDCTDIPVWCSDDTYFTYKRCCPSTHALRCLVILRRDTMTPVFVMSGAPPNGPEGSDTNMLLTSAFDDYARSVGCKVMYDQGLAQGDVKWVVTNEGQSDEFKKARGRVEAFFALCKNRFPAFHKAIPLGSPPRIHKHMRRWKVAMILAQLTYLAEVDIAKIEDRPPRKDLLSLI